MPRLLLVDDNPSIHKIAETLLSGSPIELVCVESGSEAMMLVDSGEHFDVALLDTVMPGMDGWELLSRLRKHPDSAFIPIAMMAGVLDTVDPDQLSHAPIQGFLKKPIELRELADRVQHLLATPVTLAERPESSEDSAEFSVRSPFSTVPGTKIADLPEMRGGHAASQMEEDDLLILTPEDFWTEEAVPAPAPAEAAAVAEVATAAMLGEAPPSPAETTLDLEELDLEALKDLQAEPAVPLAPAPLAALPEAAPELPEEPEIPAPMEFPPAFEEEAPAAAGMDERDTFAIPGLAQSVREFQELGRMPEVEGLREEGHPLAAGPEGLSLAIHEAAAPPVPAEEPAPAGFTLLPVPEAGPAPAAPAMDLVAPTAVEGVSHSDLVQALLSDPVLLDALARAVVTRLGDQVLREIAWEVMPELAEKLPR